jgi:hypothetical protein
MIDKNYDAHERVEHRHISTEKPSNRHRDKQPVHHHKSSICFFTCCQTSSAMLMPAGVTTGMLSNLAE